MQNVHEIGEVDDLGLVPQLDGTRNLASVVLEKTNGIRGIRWGDNVIVRGKSKTAERPR